MSGLYIHIPFCEKKCDYCAFYSVVSNDWKNEAAFFQSLETEINNIQSRYSDFLPETLFIGGGTPTAPSFQYLESLLSVLGEFSPAEFSVEANPGTVDRQKLNVLKKSGVNRLSIGVQSFNFQCLETLGRIHTAEQAEASFRQARAAGFENISLDLMFGVPGQTMQMLESDLDRALELGPEHISVYNLMVEEGTPLADRIGRNADPSQLSGIVGQASLYSESLCVSRSQANTRSRIREACPTTEKEQFAGERQLARLDEELEREMYDHIRARLKDAGFVHYEISNFAKPGFECRHNLLYWTGGEYLGCGPSAHSHWNGTRWANAADLDDYCKGGGSVGDVALPKNVIPIGRASLSERAAERDSISINDGSPGGVALPVGPKLSGRASLSERAAEWPRREFEETLDPDAKVREALVMGLRLLKGVEVSPGLFEKQQRSFQTLEKEGLLEIDGRHVRLSEEALFVSDAVFSELV